VIWGLGIISLLIVTFMTTARWRFQAAYNVAGAAAAASLAEAAVDIGVFRIVSERAANQSSPQDRAYAGEPHYCRLPGATAVIALEDESGKIDLNAASPKLLRAFLMGFGVEMSEADRLADAIAAFREPAPAGAMSSNSAESARLSGSKGARFQTALELDQVTGVEPALFRVLTPYLTTYSRGHGLDPSAAPPALFAALAGFALDDVQALAHHPYPNSIDRRDPRFPVEFKQTGSAAAFLAHAEVVLPNGSAASRDVIVVLPDDKSFVVKEVRRGSPRYLDDLRSMSADRSSPPLEDCWSEFAVTRR
jgi:general secretion pathway protein K